MLRDDLFGRFGYLFEPLEVDESAGDGDDAALPIARTTRGRQPMVAPNSPRRRRPSNACGRGGDGHCAASASPASTANSHSERLHATAHSGVYSYIPGDVNDGADHDRRTCSRLTGHGQYIRRPDTGLPPIVEPQRPPAQPPTTIASEPPGTMPPPPTTRAPISFSPESRTPFPNETPPRNNDHRGGYSAAFFS
jgi:hypothetical protein